MSAKPLNELLRELEGLLREAGESGLADEAEALSRKQRENRFHVVVMGEFKRGKSTLINALIGQPLLPVAAVPLTSVVTVVRHGPDTKAFVEFQGGHRRETAVGSIAEFVSEERNPKNEKRVERVVVETPAPFLEGGTLLVDTPGAGSVYRHNTEVAQKYMPEADAVILVLSADPPISQAEVEFLHSVRRWARKLFVIQNKTDYLDPADLDSSLSFTRKVLEEALGSAQAPLIPVSAKLALQGRTAGDSAKLAASGLAALEAQLHGFLSADKSRVLTEAVSARTAALIDRAVFELDLRLRAGRADADEWRALSARLRERLEEAKRREFELTTLYSAEIKSHEAEVEERIYAGVKRLGAKAKAELEAFYKTIRSERASAVREKLNEALMLRLEAAFSGLLEREEPAWGAAFDTVTDLYLDSTVRLVNEILGETARVLSIEARAVGKPKLAIAPPAVWFVVEKVSVWSGGIGSVPTLRVFKPFFWKAVQRKIGEALDLNAGRLRYDYSMRLERAGAEAGSTIHRFFEDCLGGIQRAVAASAAQESGSARRARVEAEPLERMKTALLALRARL